MSTIMIQCGQVQLRKTHPVLIEQKRAIILTYHEYSYAHLKPLIADIKTLNAYQLNIFQVLKFMHNENNMQTSQILTRI